MNNATRTWTSKFARAGLSSKGVVYLILGSLAFMAAFEIGGQSNTSTNRSGVLNSIHDMPAGIPLLLLLSAGLLCYCAWRIIQAVHTKERDGKKAWGKRLRYIFSCLAYLSLAFTAIQFVLQDRQSNGDQNQHWAARVMSQPFGQWLLGIAALVLAGVGIYQIWYGLSEKYRKHVQAQSTHSGITSRLLAAGKIGYLARGLVWLLLAWLLLKAALGANPGAAGDTGKAFQFVEGWAAGSYILGALGLGLIAYGIFSFIRARYERFEL